MVKVKENLIGKTFGRLTIIEQADDRIQPSGQRHAQYRCKCLCGNEIVVRAASLKNGNTASCGCLMKEKISATQKKYNDFYIDRDIVYIKLSNCEEYTEINSDKWNEIKYIQDFCWYKDHNGYVVANIPKKYKKDFKAMTIKLHQLICPCPDGFFPDHYDRNPLNNLTENLFVRTRKENNQNSSRRENNLSGFIGVSWNKDRNNWQAKIGVDGKSIYLGCFNTKEEALIVRLKAEKQYFGVQAPQRHLFEQYGIIPIKVEGEERWAIKKNIMLCNIT